MCHLVGMKVTTLVKRVEPGKRDTGLFQEPTEQERKKSCKEGIISRCSSGEQPLALGGEGVTDPKKTNKQEFLSILREGSKAITQNISLFSLL